MRNMFKDFGAVPMSENHQKQLREATYKLTQYMDPESAMCYLDSKDILTNDEIEKIKKSTTTNDQVKQLIGLLQRKSESAFFTLMEALREIHQQHVLTIIEQSGE